MSSIAHLTNVENSVLKVKRKFKTGTDGKVARWWYVIHAEEACLQQLESEWQKVELQTSWKLELCYRYLESDEQTPLSGEQCPLSEGESEAPPLDQAPTVLSQPQEIQSQLAEGISARRVGSPNHSMEGVSSHSSNFQSKSKSNSKIMYFNARNLSPKLDELLFLTDSHCPDVICITESWLCFDLLDSVIHYQTMRLDRNRHGGGVLMYVLEKYIVKWLPSHASLELLTVTLIVVIIVIVLSSS